MSLSAEAEKNKPKKPLNGYFKFRMQKLIEFKGSENRTELVKEAWEKIDPAEKAKLD